MKPRAIALHSGGLDSCVAARLAMREAEIALAITFDYGQRAAEREAEAALEFCRRFGIEHRTVELPWLAELGSSALTHAERPLPVAAAETLDQGAKGRAEAVWVPNRNGLFVAIAASFAEGLGAERVIAGFNAEEAAAFPDNGAGFIEATDRALSLSTLKRVRLLCPARDMEKGEIAAEFVGLDLDPRAFWCCYDGGERHCGACESCARSIRAFRSAGAWDLVSERFMNDE
ncbi:MAG: 7-cyano-7-deazaguanine synthase QueC [Proteobacteria bacterium]|nr:7-cyano-7-deazaguanine synthase QueC [Pseudomonadota bacterium]